jgi:hypothetical protein
MAQKASLYIAFPLFETVEPMNKTIYKCFIASPSDTQPERDICDKVFTKINETVGEHHNFRIEPLKWENHTYPSFGTDGQDVINSQIGGKYDIFLGIMWKKFGSPTPRAGSGTEEEFELAYKKYESDKSLQIMFYFNDATFGMNDIDANQVGKVQSFKTKVSKLGGLYHQYNGVEDFQEKLDKHLTNYLLKFHTATTTNSILPSNGKGKQNVVPKIAQRFGSYLNEMEATFAHSAADKVTLEDLYTVPDLQKIEPRRRKALVKTLKLTNLIDAVDVEGMKLVLAGNELAGKTAACKYIYKTYFNQGLYPVLINGEDINTNIRPDTIERLVEKHIGEQYEESFELTSETKDKVLLIIDDFHKSAKGLNKYWETLVKNVFSGFKHVVITGVPLMLIDRYYKDPFKPFSVYMLLEFGPVLRRELVHKWKTLNIDEKFLDKNDLLRKEDEALQHIKTAIGKNYFPVYPFYILSMLQALEGTTISNPNYSIHGFYYENLISRCFSKHITNKKEINLYYNYLTYFCYFLFEKQVREISNQEFRQFHAAYCQKMDIVFNCDKLLQTFSNANLLHVNHTIRVKEKYVFYFFVAKYLADNINNIPGVKDTISKMSIRIFRDDYASIIMFITHLSKDNFIIDELINNADSIFPGVNTARLEDDIKIVNTLVERIPAQVLEQVDVESEREAELKEEEENEKYEREYEADEQKSYQSFGLDDDISSIDFMAWLTMSFKTIDILGQIAKKHWGDMDKELKIRLVKSTYNLGLRFLGYYLQLLQTNADEIVDHMRKIFQSKQFTDRYSLRKSIEEETRNYVFRLCFMASFGTTKRVSSAIGDSELKLTFAKVLEETPSNAYKLIDLGIKLIYPGLPMDDIKEVKEAVEKNNLCLMVLNSLIIDHSYMFEISHTERSKINALFGTEIKEQVAVDASTKVRR